MKKVIIFTAGSVLTTQEQALVDTITAIAAQPFEVVVRRADQANYANPEPADFVIKDAALTAYPEPYDDAGTYPVFDVDAPPAEGDIATVVHGQVIEGTGGDFTVSIVDGVIGGTWDAD